MAVFVSVLNYLFAGMIALLSSFPLITDRAPDDIKEERNALMHRLLLGDWFSLMEELLIVH